jgi:KaiC/GvpD/RAD55 family RecA-like ATPase
MKRSLTSHNLLNRKPERKLEIGDAGLRSLVGDAVASGIWLIYGKEKNGKTWFSLQLAKELAKHEKVSYISAEEGLRDSFTGVCRRAGITATDRILWDGYISMEDVVKKFGRPKSASVVFIDNLTVYAEELKAADIKGRLLEVLPKKLLVLVAHEERGDAYPGNAKMARKLASVVINVKGLKAIFTSRFGGGGEVDVDWTCSEMFWGISSPPARVGTVHAPSLQMERGEI